MAIQVDFWNGTTLVKERGPRAVEAPFKDRPAGVRSPLVKWDAIWEELGGNGMRGKPEKTPCGWMCDFLDGSRYLRKWGEWSRVWGPAQEDPCPF